MATPTDAEQAGAVLELMRALGSRDDKDSEATQAALKVLASDPFMAARFTEVITTAIQKAIKVNGVSAAILQLLHELELNPDDHRETAN